LVPKDSDFFTLKNELKLSFHRTGYAFAPGRKTISQIRLHVSYTWAQNGRITKKTDFKAIVTDSPPCLQINDDVTLITNHFAY